MYLLTRRNTRRYGGYLIHIGVVVVVIGLAGAAFNRNIESETGAARQNVDRAVHAGVRRASRRIRS